MENKKIQNLDEYLESIFCDIAITDVEMVSNTGLQPVFSDTLYDKIQSIFDSNIHLWERQDDLIAGQNPLYKFKIKSGNYYNLFFIIKQKDGVTFDFQNEIESDEGEVFFKYTECMLDIRQSINNLKEKLKKCLS